MNIKWMALMGLLACTGCGDSPPPRRQPMAEDYIDWQAVRQAGARQPDTRPEGDKPNVEAAEQLRRMNETLERMADEQERANRTAEMDRSNAEIWRHSQ